ncbi:MULTISPECIES: sulfotransferase family 2 domain-containing protein [unclassified Limnobacter]|uniref:sulfotransferase family 2 domain-containing protein n=1 Tax=unclassified Limnobacter TaxID=2630203 RepID=UPI000C59112C|nr:MULTISPECIES: sulfotransferase family 2 domain-containing protein [unclassified Limnobacter]MAZ08558.1 hypothetical protein [Sutterellaceae bacterium]|tara:strand:+ start:16790 stop:17503 length:714 start_codon:yes stop_codon:yes gene_type:complete
MRPVVIFTHIPKVAGTSLVRKLVLPNYPRDLIKSYKGELDLLRSRGRYQVLVGHSVYGIQHLVTGPVKMFTMLRDPIERAISHYYFIKQPGEFGPGRNLEQKRTNREVQLAEIFEYNKHRKFRLAGTWLIDNMQTRYLAGYSHYWKSESSLSLLSAAKFNLEKRYVEFGLLDQFEESSLRIASSLGWVLAERVDKTKETRIQKIVTSEDRAAVEKWNLLDQDLHSFAQELFRKRGLR